MTIVTSATRLLAVIGDPVRHSLSPTIHNAAFAAPSTGPAKCTLPATPVSFASCSSRARDTCRSPSLVTPTATTVAWLMTRPSTRTL